MAAAFARCTLIVTLDGQTVLIEALVLWKGFSGGTPYITVGAAHLPGPSQPWSIRMDSVTMDIR
jgi:hypothetical protein